MFEEIKAWFLAHFLKRYIQPDNRKPERYPEQKPDTDLPVFRDRYWERNSDPETLAIDAKVQEAITRLKSQGKF